VPCPAGTYKRSAGAFRCLKCGTGRYQPRTASATCLTCPAGRTVNAARTTCRAPPPPPPQGLGFRASLVLIRCTPVPSGDSAHTGSCDTLCSSGQVLDECWAA